MAQKTQKTIGIYHKDCLDGTTAAAVLLKKFPSCALFPLSHNYTDGDITDIEQKIGSHTIVYIVDFSLQEKHAKRFLQKAARVVTIDHHIGVNDSLIAMRAKYKNFSYIFDNERSGASLTWIYFFDKKNIPAVVRYVEDSDIWRFSFGDKTRWAASFLYRLAGAPEKILPYLRASQKTLNHVLAAGKMLHEYRQDLVRDVVRDLRLLTLKVGKYRVPLHNTPEFIRSDVGHGLAIKLKRTVATFVIDGDTVRLHFRGNKAHAPSALLLAQSLGGGGHRNAAGARVPLKKFCAMIL